jgi:hypothetical protein
MLTDFQGGSGSEAQTQDDIANALPGQIGVWAVQPPNFASLNIALDCRELSRPAVPSRSHPVAPARHPTGRVYFSNQVSRLDITSRGCKIDQFVLGEGLLDERELLLLEPDVGLEQLRDPGQNPGRDLATQ